MKYILVLILIQGQSKDIEYIHDPYPTRAMCEQNATLIRESPPPRLQGYRIKTVCVPVPPTKEK